MTVPTTDPAAKLGQVAAGIALALSGIAGLTVITWDPIGTEIESATLAIGSVLSSSRPDLDEPEQQQGSTTFWQDWEARLYVVVDDAETSWALARSLMGQIVSAIDGQWRLGGEVQEAKVREFSIEPSDPDLPRRLVIGTATVRVKYLMPDVRI